MPAERGDVLELDELRSFVGRKANARRVWVALCRQTRQITSLASWGDRSAESARAPRGDFWLAYAEVFPARTRRSGDKSAGETCHVERWNNTRRQRLGRFVRKTLSFSECDRMHELALRPFVHEYNPHPVI